MSSYRADRYARRFLFNEAQIELGFVPVESIVVTTTYTKSRVANTPTSVGGTAYLRSRIVNSGGSV